MVYKQITVDIPMSKMRQAVLGKPIQLTASEVASDKNKMFLHPENAKKFLSAQKSGKGVRLQIAPGAIRHDLQTLEGGSIWSWIKDKAVPWVKKNWTIIKPVLSEIANVAIPAAATYLGQPQLATPVRMGLKELTGVGISGKGSPAMKDKMAKIRAMRKTQGGSFKIS